MCLFKVAPHQLQVTSQPRQMRLPKVCSREKVNNREGMAPSPPTTDTPSRGFCKNMSLVLPHLDLGNIITFFMYFFQLPTRVSHYHAVSASQSLSPPGIHATNGFQYIRALPLRCGTVRSVFVHVRTLQRLCIQNFQSSKLH